MAKQIQINPNPTVWVQGDRIEPITQTVSLKYNYSLDEALVTANEYATLRNWGMINGYSDMSEGFGFGDLPVTYVSWFDALKYCNALSEKEGMTPCFTIRGQPYRIGQLYPECDIAADGYRLPTEAEWEYVARNKATLDGDYKPAELCRYAVVRCNDPKCVYCTSPGEDILDMGDVTVIGWRRLQTVEPVKGREAINGFYDLIGDVLEWTLDVYLPFDNIGIKEDPTVLIANHRDTRYRVVKGGDYGKMEPDMPPAARQALNVRMNMKNVGFRVARTVENGLVIDR